MSVAIFYVPGLQDDGAGRDPGGRPYCRAEYVNNIINVASDNDQQSIILHTSIKPCLLQQ
jgi:hypothetical protein